MENGHTDDWCFRETGVFYSDWCLPTIVSNLDRTNWKCSADWNHKYTEKTSKKITFVSVYRCWLWRRPYIASDCNLSFNTNGNRFLFSAYAHETLELIFSLEWVVCVSDGYNDAPNSQRLISLHSLHSLTNETKRKRTSSEKLQFLEFFFLVSCLCQFCFWFPFCYVPVHNFSFIVIFVLLACFRVCVYGLRWYNLWLQQQKEKKGDFFLFLLLQSIVMCLHFVRLQAKHTMNETNERMFFFFFISFFSFSFNV